MLQNISIGDVKILLNFLFIKWVFPQKLIGVNLFRLDYYFSVQQMADLFQLCLSCWIFLCSYTYLWNLLRGKSSWKWEDASFFVLLLLLVCLIRF